MMTDEAGLREELLPLEGAGQELARARRAAGKTIDDLAAETRIPIRHLEIIEAGDFDQLPARTYAIGFSRSYAKAVGLDEHDIARKVRGELAEGGRHNQQSPVTFQPGDPARIPGRGLAWFSAFAALLLIIGAFAFFRGYFLPGTGPAPLSDNLPVADAGAAAKAPAAGASPSVATMPRGGEVVFTALQDDVWVKFYDGKGDRLMEKQMTKGETYAVPAGVTNPQIWTGQPEALNVTIGGKSIGPLAQDSQIMRDVPITAAALLARNAAAPVPAVN